MVSVFHLLTYRISGDGQDQARASNFDFTEYNPDDEYNGFFRIRIIESEIANVTAMEELFGQGYNETGLIALFNIDSVPNEDGSPRELWLEINTLDIMLVAIRELGARYEEVDGVVVIDANNYGGGEESDVEEMDTDLSQAIQSGNETLIQILVNERAERERAVAEEEGRLEEYDEDVAERARALNQQRDGINEELQEISWDFITASLRAMLDAPQTAESEGGVDSITESEVGEVGPGSSQSSTEVLSEVASEPEMENEKEDSDMSVDSEESSDLYPISAGEYENYDENDGSQLINTMGVFMVGSLHEDGFIDELIEGTVPPTLVIMGSGSVESEIEMEDGEIEVEDGEIEEDEKIY
jgi:hypothetical protein